MKAKFIVKSSRRHLAAWAKWMYGGMAYEGKYMSLQDAGDTIQVKAAPAFEGEFGGEFKTRRAAQNMADGINIAAAYMAGKGEYALLGKEAFVERV